METFAAGWMYNLDKQIDVLGKKIVITYMFGTFGSFFAACCVWFGVNGDGAVWAGFLTLFVSYGLMFALTCMFCSQKMAEEPGKWTWSTMLYEVMLKNVMDLRDDLQAVCGWIPWAWAFAMKHFIPQVLLILFINLATSSNGDGQPQFGNYGGYATWPFQIFGIAAVVIAMVMFLIGIFVPDLYKKADLYALEQDNKAKEQPKVLDDEPEVVADEAEA